MELKRDAPVLATFQRTRENCHGGILVQFFMHIVWNSVKGCQACQGNGPKVIKIDNRNRLSVEVIR